MRGSESRSGVIRSKVRPSPIGVTTGSQLYVEDVLVLGDINVHCPLWDHGCNVPDALEKLFTDRLDKEK